MSSLLHSRRLAHRLLCVVLAGLMAIRPEVSLRAQTPADTADASRDDHIVPRACAVLIVRPRQLMTAAITRLLPWEVVQAAGVKELGIDPVETKKIVISAAVPSAGLPAYAMHATFASPQVLNRGRITEHTTESDLQGRDYLQSQHPFLPSFFAPDATSLLVAPDAMLGSLVQDQQATSPLATRVADAAAGDDLYLFIDLEALRPLLNMALSRLPPNFPAEARPVLEIPALLQSVELTINLSNRSPTELLITANNEADGARVEELIAQLQETLLSAMADKMQQDAETQRMLASEDPVEQAMGRYSLRIQEESKTWLRNFQLPREGAKFQLLEIDPEELGQHRLAYVAAMGVLVALMLPAVQAAREAARRNVALNRMRQIMVALRRYQQQHESFPAHASYDDEGEPLLSWRVHILPFLGQQELYEEFHLHEAWDSEHNQQLLSRMPPVFFDPSSKLRIEQGRTHFLGVQGEGLFFDGSPIGRQYQHLSDGPSTTIAVLQVNDQRASAWTQPADWQWNEQEPLAGLAGLHRGIFLAGRCDGSAVPVSESVDRRLLKSLLTIAGGEIVNLGER